MVGERELIRQYVSRVAGGKPVHWMSERTSLGDFDGRDWTLEVFDVPPEEHRALHEQLWPLHRRVWRQMRKSLTLVLHTPEETTRLYAWVRTAEPPPLDSVPSGVERLPRDNPTATGDVIAPPRRDGSRRALLSGYRTKADRRGAPGRHRPLHARSPHEQGDSQMSELQSKTPKEALEVPMEVRLILERLDDSRLTDKEREFLRLVLQGERSSRVLAEGLELASLPEDEQRREVKRYRDRLMKWLERLGKEGADVES